MKTRTQNLLLALALLLLSATLAQAQCIGFSPSGGALPAASYGSSYSKTITLSGGTPPYHVPGQGTGSPPPGIFASISGNGLVFSGTPTGPPATYSFSVVVTDSSHCTNSSPTYSITVDCPTILISPFPLPTGTAGATYSAQITASAPEDNPFTFTVTSGSLPPGLSLSPSGLLSGTNHSSGTYCFTVQAKDTNNCTGTTNYCITVDCTAITLSPGTLPNGIVGNGYGNIQISASGGGGNGSFTFGWSGSKPPGLSLSTGGILSGTPTAPGTYSFTVTATNNFNCTGSSNYTVTIGCPTIIVNGSPPGFNLGISYSYQFSAINGNGSYTFSKTGSLPSGVSLSTSGLLSGIPNGPEGSYNFTVTATDSSTCAGSASYTLLECPSISGPGFPAGTIYQPYNQSSTVSGGIGPYSFQLISGSPGLNISYSANAITLSGTPNTLGTSSFEIQITDADGCQSHEFYSLTIDCPSISVNPGTLPAATDGTSYSQQLTTTGGNGSFNFAASSGLPNGMSLSSSGLLSGTPEVPAGDYSFTVTATENNDGCPASQGYNLTVNCPTITVGPPTLPPGTLGAPYGPQQMTASGGAAAPYTFTITSGNPGGLMLSPSGQLSGTPTNAVICFTVTATDTNLCTGSMSYCLTNSSSGCVPPPTNMVLWLPFDETNGNTSANLASPADPGTQVGAPTPMIGQYVSNSLVFNGSSYVTVPDYPGIEIGTNGLTIDAWVSNGAPANYTNTIVDKFLIQTSPFSETGYHLELGYYNLRFEMNGQSYDLPGPISQGDWHFVAVSVNQSNSTGYFYVDGSVAGMFTPTPADLSNMNSLWVGASANTPFNVNEGGAWAGALDEVEVYNRALSPTELSGIYAAGTAGKCKPCITIQCSNLVAYTCVSCTTVPLTNAVSYIDLCCTNSPTLTFSPPETNCFPVGTNMVTVIAADSCGNQVTNNFTVTVIQTSPCVPGENWTQTSAPSTNWSSVASSSDGTHLVAVVDPGPIYTSTDSGVTWAPQPGAPTTNWISVASSSDGSLLVAAVEGGGIYTSINGGTNWTQTSAPATNWVSVASSSNGAHLVAAVYQGGMYTSANGGTTWTQTSAPNGPWLSVASSSDGTHLVAAGVGNVIFTSTDSGASWTAQSGGLPNYESESWDTIASSSDGSHLVAAFVSVVLNMSAHSGIYTSVDGGTNWTQQTTGLPTFTDWRSIASSSDGSHLIAVANQGGVYTSTDGGTDWTEQTGGLPNSAYWNAVASSSDGTKLVAAIDSGAIYISDCTPCPGNSCQVFNSGMTGANGDIPLAAGTADPNFILVSEPSGAGTNAVVSSPLGPNWITNSSSSQWISPDENSANEPGGVYDYQLHFYVGCTNSQLVGRMAVDDGAVLYLNGQAVGTLYGWTNWTAVNLSSGFVQGNNVLDIMVTNIPGTFSGMRAELTICSACTTTNPCGLSIQYTNLVVTTCSNSVHVVFPPPSFSDPCCDTNSITYDIVYPYGDFTVNSTNEETILAHDGCGNYASRVFSVAVLPGNNCQTNCTITNSACQYFFTGAENGNLLTAGAADPNYILVSAPPGAGTNAVVSSPLGPGWFPDDNYAQWISPEENSANSPAGVYQYQLKFYLECTNSSLVGAIAVDDSAGLYFNNNFVETVSGPTTMQGVYIFNGFVPGINVLDIYVTNNATDWTGLFATLTNCYTCVSNPCASPCLSSTNSCIEFFNVTNFVVYACGTNCMPVDYLPVNNPLTAVDLCCTDGLTLIFDPTNGSSFCPGTTNTVTCTAISACGYCNTTNFTVTVTTNLAIALSGTNPVVMLCSNGCGWMVDASGALILPPGLQATQNPEAYTLVCSNETSTVTLTVTNDCGFVTNIVVPITFQTTCTNNCLDFEVPSNIVVTACGTNPVPVFFPTICFGPAACCEGGSAQFYYCPPSGTFLPPGTTSVQVTAWNTCGITNTQYFSVTVVPDANPPVITRVPPFICVPTNTTVTGHLIADGDRWSLSSYALVNNDGDGLIYLTNVITYLTQGKQGSNVLIYSDAWYDDPQGIDALRQDLTTMGYNVTEITGLWTNTTLVPPVVYGVGFDAPGSPHTYPALSYFLTNGDYSALFLSGYAPNSWPDPWNGSVGDYNFLSSTDFTAVLNFVTNGGGVYVGCIPGNLCNSAGSSWAQWNGILTNFGLILDGTNPATGGDANLIGYGYACGTTASNLLGPDNPGVVLSVANGTLSVVPSPVMNGVNALAYATGGHIGLTGDSLIAQIVAFDWTNELIGVSGYIAPTNTVCGVMPNAIGLIGVSAPYDVIVSQSIPAGTTICSDTDVVFTVEDGCGFVTNIIVPVALGSCSNQNTNGCQYFRSGMSGDGDNIPLAAGAADLNFMLVSEPPGAGTSAVVSSPTAPNWIPDSYSPFSQWISPEENSQGSPPGIYHYQLQFFADCTNSQLYGWMAADDMAWLYLNGQPAGTVNGWTSPTFINLTSGIEPGINTLDVIVTNVSSWTGIRAELTNCYSCASNECASPCIQFSNATNLVAYSCGSNCVPVYYPVTAADVCCTNTNAPITLTFDPPNGTCFGPGTSVVTCWASSACGNCNTTNFYVTVIPEGVPPTITCPSNIVVGTACSNAQVYFDVTASGGLCSNVSLVIDPPSGSFFPVGTNTVTAVATDCCGNSNSCSFTVTVIQETCVAGQVWTPQNSGSRGWDSIASSADGSKLVALSGNGIFTSSNYGVTWVGPAQNTLSIAWQTVASSADGSKLVAAVAYGPIYTSTDSGATWTAQNVTNLGWFSVASSSDGSKLAAAPINGQMYTSTDSGITWVAQNSGFHNFISVASSSDGSKLVAGTDGGEIFTSADSGATWNSQPITNSNIAIPSVASSADGTKLVAAVGNPSFSGGPGLIYTSADSGATWTSRASSQAWASVASSADGTKLVAVAYGAQIYTSTDSGITWTAQNSGSNNWYSVASSSDGSKLAAGVSGGVIYTSDCTNEVCCVPAPTNMVMWLPFDETNGSISANLASPADYGTQVNNPKPLIGSYVDNSLQFYGTNYVVVPNYPGIAIGTGDFTIDAWVETETNTVATNVIVDKRAIQASYPYTTTSGYSFLFSQSGGLNLSLPGQFHSGGFPGSSAPGWHFVAVSISQSTSTGYFYADGALAGTPFSVTQSDLSNTNALWVASSPYSPAMVAEFPWVGPLDEVEVYNRALSTNELNMIYSAGTGGKCKPCCYLNDLTINYLSSANSVQVNWGGCGILEQATNLLGPWSPIQNAVSPYVIRATGKTVFYRLECP